MKAPYKLKGSHQIGEYDLEPLCSTLAAPLDQTLIKSAIRNKSNAKLLEPLRARNTSLSGAYVFAVSGKSTFSNPNGLLPLEEKTHFTEFERISKNASGKREKPIMDPRTDSKMSRTSQNFKSVNSSIEMLEERGERLASPGSISVKQSFVSKKRVPNKRLLYISQNYKVEKRTN